MEYFFNTINDNNASDFQYAVLSAVGRSVGCGYARTERTMIRMKDHQPNFFRVQNEIEEGKYDRFVNVIIGTSCRRDRRDDVEIDRDNLISECGDVVVDIEVNEGDTVDFVVSQIMKNII